MPYYAVIRGPLGAGKTTVARALARAIDGTVVSIDALVEEGWDGGSEALFLRANIPAAARATRLLHRGEPVVFDGNFYWARALDDLIERLPFPHRVFTLVVPLSVCTARDRTRSASHGPEAAREVFAKVARARRGVPIDGTRPVPRIVAELKERLAPLAGPSSADRSFSR